MYATLLILAFVVSPAEPPPLKACDPKALPKFSDFPVTVETIDEPKLDLSSHPIGPQFRTRLRKAARSEPPNLAGHFLLTGWGCGSGCQMFAIVNLKNGRIWHDGSEILSRGAMSRPDSALVILNDGPAPTPEFAPTRYLRWTGKAFEPLCQHLEVAAQQ